MVLSYLFKSSIISYNTEWYLEQNTLGPDLCTISAIFQKKMPNKLWLSWVKLKFSLVRVVVPIMFFRALKASKLEDFRALKASKLEDFRALKASNLAVGF